MWANSPNSPYLCGRAGLAECGQEDFFGRPGRPDGRMTIPILAAAIWTPSLIVFKDFPSCFAISEKDQQENVFNTAS